MSLTSSFPFLFTCQSINHDLFLPVFLFLIPSLYYLLVCFLFLMTNYLVSTFISFFLPFFRLLINSCLPFSPPVHFYHSTFLPVLFSVPVNFIFLHILLFSSLLLLINSSHNLSFHLFSSINQLFFFT